MDTLVYQSKFTYFDGATQKVQISNQWLDGAGRTIRAGAAAGPTITSFDAVKSVYDDLGRLRKNTNPYNTTNSDGNTTGLPNATVYNYDSLGRVLAITLPDTNTVTTSYNGALTTVTDQVGRQKRSEVDGLGRTIKVTEMDNSKQLTWDTTYGYDLNDNLTSVNQGGQTRAFKYDSLSRMTFERTPEQDATINDGTGVFWSAKHTYTSFNAIATREDARHVITNYSYDGLNRLYQVGYTLPSPNPGNVQATATVNITYGSTTPKNGQVEEMKQSFSQSDVPWKESYVYDGLSRLSSKTVSFDSQAHSYTTGYGYNQASQLTQMTYPSTKVVKYGFDSRGRLNTVGDDNVAGKYVSSIGFQPSQQVASIGLGNGLTENYGYSADRLQLTSQNVKQGTNTLMSLTYNYVADRSRSGGVGTGTANTGQLMDITSSQINGQPRNESYNYDQVARLTQASGFYTQRNYIYDRWGNRTGVSGGDSQSVTLQQPGGGVTNNRIANVNAGPSYIYDATGNTTFDAVHGFSYDAESRIVKVDSGSTATYSYDSANRRVKKVAEGHTTYFVWEGHNVIAEYGDAAGGQGGTRFYHPDRLSNRMITDNNGAVKGAMDNLPFGEDRGVIGESEKHRFTSYERDNESNTDYAMNRQYQTNTGRFLRPDPITGNAADPQTLNRYAYTANDPINLVDPTGLIPGFCPAEFGSCGQATVYIPGYGYTGVTIGYDGSGGGTFLWDTSRGPNSFLARLEIAGISLSGLPVGFQSQATVNIKFLPNDGSIYSPSKWNPAIKEILTGYLNDSECVNAYKLVGIDLPDLLKKGITVGPADALKKLGAGALGLSPAAQTAMRDAFFRERGHYSAEPLAISTVGGAGTNNGRPKIFLGPSSLTDLKEVLAHELIHSGGGFQRKGSGANDLSYMGVGYDNILDTCAK